MARTSICTATCVVVSDTTVAAIMSNGAAGVLAVHGELIPDGRGRPSLHLRAGCACVPPLLDLRRKFFVRHGNGGPAFAWVPAPHHQFVFSEVLDQLIEISIPVLLWVFD